MRLIIATLLLLAPTALAAGQVFTLEIASEGVLGDSIFNLALVTPATATRSGPQSLAFWTMSSPTVEARYILDGETSLIPVVVSGAGYGADTSAGTLVFDVTGVGAGNGFRATIRATGASGTFVGQGSVGHGSEAGAIAALVETSS